MVQVTKSTFEMNSDVDLSKKRKIRDDHLGFPVPKYKFRDKENILSYKIPIQDEPKSYSNNVTIDRPDNSLLPHKNIDSISSEESNSSMVLYPEFTSSIDNLEPSTSSSFSSTGCDDESFSSVDQAMEAIRKYDGYTCSEYRRDKNGDTDLGNEEHYSNEIFDLPPDLLGIQRDGKEDGKQLTIDKEFEEYFSMLML